MSSALYSRNEIYVQHWRQALKLLANDIRWQILAALAQSDLRVQELVAIVAKPINLVSYHLKLLRGEEIVHERRSSANGRDIYYTLDLARLDELYQASGAQLHPHLFLGLAWATNPTTGSPCGCCSCARKIGRVPDGRGPPTIYERG